MPRNLNRSRIISVVKTSAGKEDEVLEHSSQGVHLVRTQEGHMVPDLGVVANSNGIKPVSSNDVKVGSATLWIVSRKSLNNIIQEEKDSLREDNHLLIKRLKGKFYEESLF